MSKVSRLGDILNISTFPASHIMVVSNGEEIKTDSRFFQHEPIAYDRHSVRYPLMDTPKEQLGKLPFASLRNRPPLHAQVKPRSAPMCPECLSDTTDPPPYTN